MVRKMIFSLIGILVLASAHAQEVAEEATKEDPYFSETIKMYLVVAIFALSIFFTVRTFRNKPDA